MLNLGLFSSLQKTLKLLVGTFSEYCVPQNLLTPLMSSLCWCVSLFVSPLAVNTLDPVDTCRTLSSQYRVAGYGRRMTTAGAGRGGAAPRPSPGTGTRAEAGSSSGTSQTVRPRRPPPGSRAGGV